MRQLIPALPAMVLLMLALGPAPARADETDPPRDLRISGHVAGVSDYRWRGISYSNGDPAVQGQLQLDHASGFYAGAWGSSVAQDAADVFGGVELDLYAGYTREIASGITADVGITWFTYPAGTTGTANFAEPYAAVSATLGPATAKLGISHAWRQAALGNRASTYVYGDLAVGVPGTPVELGAHLGHASGALSPRVLTGAGNGGGFDYSLSATAQVHPRIALGITYVGVDGAPLAGFSDDALVGSVKFSF